MFRKAINTLSNSSLLEWSPPTTEARVDSLPRHVSLETSCVGWLYIRLQRFSQLDEIHQQVLCQMLLQVSSIEEEKLWFFTIFLAVTFWLANFSYFSQQFRNQHKILRCFDTHIQILQRKSLYVISTFWNFKARFARNGSKFWKMCFQKCLIITFYAYKTWTPFILLKNIKIAVPYYICSGTVYCTKLA